MRIRILQLLRERPSNTNQLSVALGADYKTIQHHIRSLSENRLIETKEGTGYGATHFLSQELEGCISEFDLLCAKLAPRPAPAAVTDPNLEPIQK